MIYSRLVKSIRQMICLLCLCCMTGVMLLQPVNVQAATSPSSPEPSFLPLTFFGYGATEQMAIDDANAQVDRYESLRFVTCGERTIRGVVLLPDGPPERKYAAVLATFCIPKRFPLLSS